MDNHAFKVLEFHQVRKIYADRTTNLYGKENIDKRYPLKDREQIDELQEQTREALSILNSQEPFTVGHLEDVRESLILARKQVPLSSEDILHVFQVAKVSRQLKKYLSVREALVPRICELSMQLETFRDFEKTVRLSIGEDGTILDSASSRLREIRKSIDKYNSLIHDKLDGFLKNPAYAQMLQEKIFTRREHRYVLPVKQEFRSRFPGIALDSSASGATVFMEPLSILDLTNELKYQIFDEKREIEHIRLEITREIAEISRALEKNIEIIGHFDALMAAARFMIEFDASLPKISQKPVLNLRKARHPLLGEKAVPIDIRIGKDFRGLVITGPNTGGKTVSLKTAGVLTLLALSGLPVTCGEDSIVGTFTGVFADIGDEQSIRQNLSTFSSHMTNIIKILPCAGKKTLVILDEIGAGTDPSEGVSLAIGILEYLINRGCRVIASTHYNQLKIFAGEHPEFSNAAVEFDEETLKPTYHLQIGLPGRSCALKVAEKLGLDSQILSRSREIMGQAHFRIENLLSEIDKERAIAQKERMQAQLQRQKLNHLQEEYNRKLEEVEMEKSSLLEEAVDEIESYANQIMQELKDTRKEWRKSLKEYREGKKSREETRSREKRLRSKLDQTIDRLRNLAKIKEEEEVEIKPVRFVEGEPVNVEKLGRRGHFIEMLDNRNALVQVGNIKIEVPMRDLKKAEVDITGKATEEVTPLNQLKLQKALSVSDEIDLRGMRVDEAIEKMKKYIDDALLANLNSFQVIHGKGTGTLRKAIREFLDNSPRVESYRDGELHEGGWGVTVVKL